jgi:hypothetical protein
MNGTIVKPASAKQLKWLRDLLEAKDYSGFPEDWQKVCDSMRKMFADLADEGYEPGSMNVRLIADEREPITHDDFQRLLTKLQAAPNAKAGKTAGQIHWPSAKELPAGRYGIPTAEGALNETAFYTVDRPDEGKWAGYVFVHLLLSDNEHKLPVPQQKAIARKIAEYGAEKASAAYGLKFKHCGICGRGLTNDDSRERGIGPKCAAKYGW